MTTQKKPTISALVIAHNEEVMLGSCLDCLQWCDELLVIDCGSTDATALIAEQHGAKVISFSHPSFARLREEAAKRSTGDWLLYIDADERVSQTLAKEIQVNIETGTGTVFSLLRSNHYFGQQLEYGGWGSDVVHRLFARDSLQGWYGDIHESPRFTGQVIQLKAPLIHLTHRSVADGLYKSARWTPLEAKALFEAQIPPVTFLTLLRKGTMEFLRRAFLKKGYRDGLTGMIEALIQGINRMLVYMQVWELQQKPPISDRYAKLEEEIKAGWKSSA